MSARGVGRERVFSFRACALSQPKTMKIKFNRDALRLDKRILFSVIAVCVVMLLLAVPVWAAVNHNGIICDGGESNCVESWYGGSIRVYSDAGTTQKFAVVGSNGNTSIGGDLTVTGVITTNGGYIGVTPVATATARPHWCGVQSVTGAATVIPATLTAAGVTTPRAPVASLGQDITLDADSVTTSNSAGVVTLKVWQLRTAATTTPQAASGAATVNYCVDGN